MKMDYLSRKNRGFAQRDVINCFKKKITGKHSPDNEVAINQ